MSRENNSNGIGLQKLDSSQNIYTQHSRHLVIANDKTVPVLLRKLYPFDRVSAVIHLEPFSFKALTESYADSPLVIDQKN